jgi:hypothetical protein
MNSRWPLVAAVAALTAEGCSGTSAPAPPATVQRDVSDARKQAAESNANAARALALAEEGRAAAEYKARITEAEGKRAIALAQCEALSGAAQKACRDQANAEFDLAKATAKADKIEHR